MSEETIVAIYDTPAHGELAAADLKAAGIAESAISVHVSGTGDAGHSGTTAYAPGREQGFWSGLFGGEPDHDTTVYDRSLAAGSTVVTAKVPETQVSQVVQILEEHKPIDIDERAAGYGLAQAATRPAPAAAAVAGAQTGGTLQLSEESLVVGKRVVNRGGTRIRRFVVETPVEETVMLHEETVTVERRPVTDGRPLSGDEFGEKTIEMMQTAEEAVVGKTSRVVEEVGLRKEATDRTETVHDTVRKEEVAVEPIPGSGPAATSGTGAEPRTPES